MCVCVCVCWPSAAPPVALEEGRLFVVGSWVLLLELGVSSFFGVRISVGAGEVGGGWALMGMLSGLR